MTCTEWIQHIKNNNPGLRIAKNDREDALAYFENGNWIMFLGKTIINDKWARIPNLLVNGEPTVKNWIEV